MLFTSFSRWYNVWWGFCLIYQNHQHVASAAEHGVCDECWRDILQKHLHASASTLPPSILWYLKVISCACVRALCLCRMAFPILNESNRGDTLVIFLIKAYGVWRISCVPNSWQDIPCFLCLSLSCLSQKYILWTQVPFLKAKLTKNQALGQSDACLPG